MSKCAIGILKVRNLCVCVGVEFLACNVLLHTKSEQKVIGSLFYSQIILKIRKKRLFKKKYTFTICVGECLDCKRIFLIRKTSF